MKQLKYIQLVIILSLSFIHPTYAYDFYSINQNDTIYYHITSNTDPYTVEVTSEVMLMSSYAGSIEIPSTVLYNSINYSVTGIANLAFFMCKDLTEITFPITLKSIGTSAFAYCTGLTSITIPDSVTFLSSPFDECSSLKTVYYNAINCNTNSSSPFWYCDSITTFVFGPNVEVIPSQLCQGLRMITSISIPSTVEIIGDGAFTNCSGISSLTLPNSLKKIGYSAFNACSGISGSLFIPNSVDTIDDYAFSECSSLTSVTIPDSLKKLGEDVFYGNSNLTTINFNAIDCESTGWTSPFNVCENLSTFIFGPKVKRIPKYLFCDLTNFDTITIPPSVRIIDRGAFMNCNTLTSITIPDSVITIGDQAFYNCSGLSGALIIPNSVTSIGQSAFNACNNISSITLSQSLTAIQPFTFYDCNGILDSIIIPVSVKSIGEEAFWSCSKITSFTIPDSVTYIGDNAFFGNNNIKTVNYNAICCHFEGLNSPFPLSDSLKTFNFGPNVRKIPAYLCSGLSGITSIIIPNSVDSIEENAFWSCINVSVVVIGSSVTYINGSAFYICVGVEEITSHALTPPVIDGGQLESILTNIPIYVPCGSENDYKNASGWSDFSNIQEGILTFTIKMESNDLNMGTAAATKPDCINHQSILSATPETDYQFLKWNDGNTENPRTVTITQDTSFTAEFVAKDNIMETNNLNKLLIYPNPAKYQLTLDNANVLIKEFYLYNLLGEEIKRCIINQTKYNLDISELKPGIYFVKVQTSQGFIIKKLIKE
ncbi:MAG: leucine-rich repeat domain-containing protein [Bacteroidales bacterium]|jgi:hypothetical protein